MKSKGGTFTRKSLESFPSIAPDQFKDWAQQQLTQSSEVHQEIPEDGDDDDMDPSDLLPKDKGDEDDAEADTSKISAPERRAGVSRLSLMLVILLAAALIVIVQMVERPQPESTIAMPSNHPSISASSLAAMDQAQKLGRDRETGLKAQAEVDPIDVEARLKLGTPYYNTTPYPEVIPQLQFILDQNPDNLDTLPDIGTAEYKTGQYGAAEKHWPRITELAPQRAEPWYSLGLLHMARTSTDPTRAREAWKKMIEIDSGSNMAKEVTTHLNSLVTPTAAMSSGS